MIFWLIIVPLFVSFVLLPLAYLGGWLFDRRRRP